MVKRSKRSISWLVTGLTSFLVLSPVLQAQNPTKYIKWTGQGDKFHTVYQNWTPGTPLYPNAAEDEHFFISRVKCRARFINRNTQAVTDITNENEKKVINWVPIGTTDNGNPNALPSGIFDSDVFSMWNMITHYGNWTAPLVRIPGAFMDAAHKNGVSTSVLSSIPWAQRISAHDGTHGQDLATMYNGGAEKFLKLLKQYGIDGWGVNSEFSTDREFATRLKTFMADVYERAITNQEWPSYSVPWYTLVTNEGGVSIMNGLMTNNKEWYHYNGRPVSNYQFTNYNWFSSELETGANIATNAGRDPFEVYAGMNLQGAEGNRWSMLKNAKASIGLWGAHNMNMFFESRHELGSAPEVKQATYLLRTERFFGNGNQNPIRRNPLQNVLTVSADRLRNFHGISTFVSAKSVLQWDLDQMPFYSFFNMGNGRFFNIEGEAAYTGEWYNIGMQDYLPTWRYWFAKTYLGKEAADNGLAATFTWDDAWFGGSSLQISGTNAADEYFHLFKTKFLLKNGDKIRIRLKVVNGSTSISLVGSAENSETQVVSREILKADKIELGEWQVFEIPVSTGLTGFRMVDKTLAAIGLKFSASENLVLCIGEFSITRGAVEKPAMPTIKAEYTKAYSYGYKGVDGKIVFEMARPTSVPEGQLIYNEDVKTSFFKIYSQQQGKDAKFVGATTSWAALCLAAPFDGAGDKFVRFGVQAVGLDGVTVGDIAWSNYVSAGQLSISDNVVVDKSAIKPNETFKVSLEDPNHPAVKWEILNGENVVLHTVESATSFTHSLPTVGLYHVRATGQFDGQPNQVRLFTGLIQVSGDAVGAVPQILTLTFNGQETAKAEPRAVNTLAYTGRTADGAVSRGLNLQESPLGLSANEMFGSSVSGQPDYTLAFWIKFNSLIKADDGIHMLNVREPDARWPQNNWGHLWSSYVPPTATTSGVYRLVLRGRSTHMENRYEGLDFKIGVWTHIAYVFQKVNNRTVPKLYVNGKYVPSTSWGREGQTVNQGENTTGFSDLNSLTFNYMILFGGEAHKRAGVDGILDDVKFYTRALSAEEVAAQMYSTTPFTDASHSDLQGFWDFETNPNEHRYFVSPQTNKRLAVGKLNDNSSSGEGRRIFTPLEPQYEAGSPFISGSAFQVKTTAKWDFPRAQVTKVVTDREDTAGSASVTYSKQGTYKGTLTLTNSWGSDSRTIEAINITSIEGMTDEISLQAFPNPFVETVYVRFAEAGAYELAVYDLSGGMVSRQAVTSEAGGLLQVSVDAPVGTYLLRITKGGILLQTLKLQKK